MMRSEVGAVGLILDVDIQHSTLNPATQLRHTKRIADENDVPCGGSKEMQCFTWDVG